MADGMKERTRGIVLWALAVVLAASFAFHSWAKLSQQPFEVVAFTERWHYPIWFMLLTGAIEGLGAIGLLWPRTRPFAAVGLCGVMLGAIATHIRWGEAAAIGFPGLHLAIAAAIAWLERARIVAVWQARGKATTT